MKYLLTFIILIKLIYGDDSDCGLVAISKWSSKPLNDPVPLSKPVNLVIIQHTATETCSDDASCEILLKNIKQKHVEILKFKNIGNSFYVAANGKIYEGAGWNVGAHTRGFNDKSIGLSFIGDFREVAPSDEALKAAQEFLACNVNNKNLAENYNVVGHGQLSATLSPGAKLQSIIEAWPHYRDNVS